jgi:dienelactone hydrolase
VFLAVAVGFLLQQESEECILDVLMGIELLKGLGIDRIGLAGWSFGGAVAIDAGIISDDVVAVATVASQTYGTEAVDRLAPK